VRKSIPLAQLELLASSRRRTTAVRAGLGAGVAALLVVAATIAFHPSQREVRFLPQASDGIVVLDVSASISSDSFQRIGTTLRDLAAGDARYGLVLFSDVAYDALPPGTPSRELAPYARFFTLPAASRSGFLPQYPANPWTDTFSGGTRISAGLGLALQRIRADRLSHPGVVLVSDLDDDPGDLRNLASVTLAYRQLGIPVRIVALDPARADEQLFSRLLAGAAHVTHARAPGTQRAQGARLPLTLVVLALCISCALAAFELWSANLVWGEAA
jgi:hypothetical protein